MTVANRRVWLVTGRLRAGQGYRPAPANFGCRKVASTGEGAGLAMTDVVEVKTAVAIDALQPGVYFITAADPVSGGKVVKRVVKE